MLNEVCPGGEDANEGEVNGRLAWSELRDRGSNWRGLNNMVGNVEGALVAGADLNDSEAEDFFWSSKSAEENPVGYKEPKKDVSSPSSKSNCGGLKIPPALTIFLLSVPS